MKSTVEQLSPTRVKLNVEVPFDELQPNFDRAYKKIANQVTIPGFRPGKAPARILEQRVGRAPVLDEVVQEAVPAKYAEALQSGEVRPMGQPEIEVTKIEDGDLLAFSAEVDVRPQIELPAFGELSVTVDDAEVTDEDVDTELNSLRSRFATLVGVDRPAQRGDYVVVDLSATVDGQEVEEAQTSGLSYEVGSGDLIEGLDEALVDTSEGEERTFTSQLVAGEHAGRDAEITVKLTAVKERELPERDDEFAQLASEFDTLAELEADLRQRLEQAKPMQQVSEARDKVLDALLEATDVPLPESLVDGEVQARRQEALHSFDDDEQRLDEYLATQGQTREQFEQELRDNARQAAHTQLVLDAIADAEDLSVSEEELTERIMFQAQRYGMEPEQFAQRVQQAGQLGSIYADVRRGKALASLVSSARVTDASGNTVDVDALMGTTPDGAEVAGPDADPEQPETADQPAVVEAATEDDTEEGTASAEGAASSSRSE